MRPTARVIRYYEGRIAHNGVECPDGFGRIHPTIGWTVWVAWKWWLGGPIDAINDAMHRAPILRNLWCPRICDRLVGERGPWMPIKRVVVPIPWDKSPYAESDPHIIDWRHTI